ncbi:MAG TPA: hypothetical protein VIB02_03490, partial [Candidatus Limnocylindrales bacterium]
MTVQPESTAGALDIQAVLWESNVQAVLDDLEHDLVALEPVKSRIREIAALLVVDKLRFEVGLASDRPSL